MHLRFQAIPLLRRAWIPIVISIFFQAPATVAQTIDQKTNPFVVDDPGAIQQVSLAKETSSDPIAGPQRDTTQLRVAIRYLLVDDAIRREIYAQLPTDSIRRATHTPTDPPSEDLAESSQSDRCQIYVNMHGHSATCVLDSHTANELVKLATESPACKVSQAPGLILQPNRAAEIRDLVQRPMVVDVQQEGELFKPVIRLVDEGTRMRILVRSEVQTSGGGSVRLTTEFQDTRILAINSTEILSLQDTPTTVQNPLCRFTRVIATEELGANQLLLIDPHIKKSTTVDFETETMLSRLPVVGRAFTDTESKSVENHLLVLVRPTVL